MAFESRLTVQWSVRELLAITAFIGLGLAALRFGGILAALTVFASLIVCIGLAIIAIVGRHQRQAFAIGFMVSGGMYAVTLFAAGESELDPYVSKLPTTQLLGSIFRAVVKEAWTDRVTGKVIPNYVPPKTSGGGGMGGMFGPTVILQEYPDRRSFMLLGHILVALGFGYAGGKFAVVVYRRREK